MSHQKQQDGLTGQDTTGHEWDGIRELNNPLPRWWLYVFYAAILFAVVWMVLYPSMPYGRGYFHGLLHYSSRVLVAENEAAAEARLAPYMDRIKALPIGDIHKDPKLLDFALNAGRTAFANNCQPCHGPGGSGRKGFPVLASDAWLWGGTLDAIQQTITYGIRSGHPQARDSAMPRFGVDGMLPPDQIDKVADYVLYLEGKPPKGVDLAQPKQIFMDNCAPCHGDHGQGNQDVGAPRYFNRVFLYGSDHDAIVRQVTNPHMGVMPAWTYRLDAATIKCLALYVHALGGGE